MSIVIIKPGLHATLQDAGRWGFQSQGVPVSGAMDEEALVTANLLVNNNRSECCLEFSSGVVELKFTQDIIFALSGRGMKASIKSSIVEFNRPMKVEPDSILKLQPKSNGNWTYLSVYGGFDIPKVLNSRSTYLPSSFGGLNGRRLKAADVIAINQMSDLNDSWKFRKQLSKPVAFTNWGAITPLIQQESIRIFSGNEWGWLSDSGKELVQKASFTISQDSNRMGYRLIGARPERTDNQELVSDAVAKGTIQLTNEGNLIVLMADGQTVGGYPRIAQVVAVDLPKLAQKRSGEEVRFNLISFEEAEQLFLDRERERNKLEAGIRLKKLYEY